MSAPTAVPANAAQTGAEPDEQTAGGEEAAQHGGDDEDGVAPALAEARYEGGGDLDAAVEQPQHAGPHVPAADACPRPGEKMVLHRPASSRCDGRPADPCRARSVRTVQPRRARAPPAAGPQQQSQPADGHGPSRRVAGPPHRRPRQQRRVIGKHHFAVRLLAAPPAPFLDRPSGRFLHRLGRVAVLVEVAGAAVGADPPRMIGDMQRRLEGRDAAVRVGPDRLVDLVGVAPAVVVKPPMGGPVAGGFVLPKEAQERGVVGRWEEERRQGRDQPRRYEEAADESSRRHGISVERGRGPRRQRVGWGR